MLKTKITFFFRCMEFDNWTIKLRIVQKIAEFKHPHDGTRKMNMVFFLKMPKGYIVQEINELTDPNWLIDRINNKEIYIQDGLN